MQIDAETINTVMKMTDPGIRFIGVGGGLYRKTTDPKAVLAYDALPAWAKDLPGLSKYLARDEAGEGEEDPTAAILQYLRDNMPPAALDGFLKRMGDAGLSMRKIAADEPAPFSGRPRPNNDADPSTRSMPKVIPTKVGTDPFDQRLPISGDSRLAYDASTRTMTAEQRTAFAARYPDAGKIRTMNARGF